MTKKFDARNAEKSRAVCEAMAERADTGKRALSEREREILDMWPRYEDGEPVWFGDGAAVNVGNIAIEAIEFTDGCAYVKDGACGDYNTLVQVFKHVKRPAPEVLDADGVPIKVGDTVYELETGEEYKVERVFSGATDPDFPDHTIRCNKVADPITHVFKPDQLTHRHIVLDADGVEIKVGDTVWHEDGSELHVIGFGDAQNGETMLAVEYAAGPTKWCEVRCLSVTHTRPDSWEQLEEDAVKVVCEYAGAVPDEFGDYNCDTCRLFDARGNLICEQLMTREIVRRAKALAGVEVD